MEMLIWGGALVTLAGLVGLIWCIVRAMRLRKAEMTEDETRAALQKLLPLNLGALLLSGFGLMMVVTGIILS